MQATVLCQKARNTRYDKIDDKNYLETRFLSTGFMVGLHISVAYRFQVR